MIQDILPSRLNNSWQNIQPQPESFVMCFREGRLLAKIADCLDDLNVLETMKTTEDKEWIIKTLS